MSGATYNSFDQVGIKEDISDIISNISPTKTPFQSMIGVDKVTNTHFKWQEDSIRDVKVNKKVEGFTAAASARTPTAFRDNVTQIMEDTFEVSATGDAVATYGRAKESAYQASKSSAAVKRDLEHAFVGTAQTKVDPSDNTTERVMAGYQAMVDSGNIVVTGSPSTKITEAKYLDALQAVYAAGADPSVTMVTPTNSREIADFAKASGRYRTLQTGSKDRAIINVVDLYVSPYGEQKIVLNRFLKDKYTLVYDPDFWKKMILRNWSRQPLAKVGDKTDTMIVGEFSLKHKNFKASAMVVESA